MVSSPRDRRSANRSVLGVLSLSVPIPANRTVKSNEPGHEHIQHIFQVHGSLIFDSAAAYIATAIASPIRTLRNVPILHIPISYLVRMGIAANDILEN